MKTVILTLITVFAFSMQGYSQIEFPVSFRVEKQSMSTPMTVVEDMLFVKSYYTKPLNISFDGEELVMKYDNGQVFTKKNVSKVNYQTEFEDNTLSMETFEYTDDANNSDLILFTVNYSIGYFEIVLTAKNSKGESIGYTSYRKYIPGNELAFN